MKAQVRLCWKAQGLYPTADRSNRYVCVPTKATEAAVEQVEIMLRLMDTAATPASQPRCLVTSNVIYDTMHF